MRIFDPTREEIDSAGGVLGYPGPGRYVLMVEEDRILGGEIERPGEFMSQRGALHRCFPATAETVVAVLYEDGAFIEEQPRTDRRKSGP